MFSEKMQVVLGSQYHEHLREWVGSTGLRSLYIHTLIYLHKHAYIYSDICSIYISVKAGVLQKLAFKKFYINMSQCLTNFVGLRALRENCGFPARRTSFLFPPKLHKVPWISVPPMQRITRDRGSSLPRHRSPLSFCFYFDCSPLFASCSPWPPHGKHAVFAEPSRRRWRFSKNAENLQLFPPQGRCPHGTGSASEGLQAGRGMAASPKRRDPSGFIPSWSPQTLRAGSRTDPRPSGFP